MGKRARPSSSSRGPATEKAKEAKLITKAKMQALKSQLKDANQLVKELTKTQTQGTAPVEFDSTLKDFPSFTLPVDPGPEDAPYSFSDADTHCKDLIRAFLGRLTTSQRKSMWMFFKSQPCGSTGFSLGTPCAGTDCPRLVLGWIVEVLQPALEQEPTSKTYQ